MFFNQARLASVEEPLNGDKTVGQLINQLENKTWLQLLANPPWMDSKSYPTADHLPVATVSGLTDNKPSYDNCTQSDYCKEGTVVASQYDHCVRTSLDSVQGSSGGLMLMEPPHLHDADETFYRPSHKRYGYGVLNGAIVDKENQEVVNLWDDSYAVPTNNGFPTEDNFTAITLGNSLFQPWGDRTTDYSDNDPNPFNPVIAIGMDIPSLSDVVLSVYDIRGRKVFSLVRKGLSAGRYDFLWRGVDNTGRYLPSGIYFFTASDGHMTQAIKITLLK